jgi:two-component system sensor histidine kinase KdpD
VTRGTFRIYLGAAPGVGKTFAMLGEGQRRRARGADVVVGVVEDHGRARTREAAEGLPTVPRVAREHRGAAFEEMDLDGVLLRRPDLVLVDELAHTNAPGSRHEKRWQDVEEILDAGIDVLSTVNVQHLASLNDVVEKVTGVVQRETVPDEVVRRADQIELVDMTPEALRRRMAHGNVYPAERVDAALGSYFRVGNLTALRELALLWLADKVEAGLKDYRRQQGISATWETRERVVVALTGGSEGETLLRRAARIAARSSGGDLLAVHVARGDGLRDGHPDRAAAERLLAESLGASYHLLVSDDVPSALLEFARSENATQLVLGASRRGRVAAVLRPGIGQAVVRRSGSIDVHLVTHEQAARRRTLPRIGSSALSPARRWAAVVLGLVLLPALTSVLTQARGQLGLSSELLLFLVATLVIALVGGLLPALLAAVAAAALTNWFFTEPTGSFTINGVDGVVAVVVFFVVAVSVAWLVDLAARRTREAARARAEAMTLATLSGDVLRGERTLPALLDRVRELFVLDHAELREGDRSVAASGQVTEAHRTEVPVGDRGRLVLTGRELSPGDRRIVDVLAGQAAVSLERGRLKAEAAQAQALAEVDRQRTSLLAAVGHDLRTPLAAAKAAITGLRSTDVTWSDGERAELEATADESLDQLDDVVTNLLDMSRLQVGALTVHREVVSLSESVLTALVHLPPGVQVDVPTDLPLVDADPGLLERVLVNVVGNALRHNPVGSQVRVSAAEVDERVELRVCDHGPGVRDADKERVFAAFQRLDDRSTASSGHGVGLGLAISRGFVEAMGGTLEAEDTPGGGLTMVIALPVAA